MATIRPPLSLKGRALRYLAGREHSRLELERKLTPHLQEGEDLPALLDYLQAQGFINEARVMESLLHQKAGRMGALRLRQQLRAKGLDAEAVEQALTELQQRPEGSELERAQALWQKRFGQTPTDANERLRQMRFLATRGFSSDAVRRAVPRLGSD